jgi:hypothetical protein
MRYAVAHSVADSMRKARDLVLANHNSRSGMLRVARQKDAEDATKTTGEQHP